MEDAEDNWVREFDVSNPQKTHAGYTVYRVSSKLYPKGSPEAASEVIVFKRYSEIRKLYKELKMIYENNDNQLKKFPHFSKANFFSRFDEAVIKERQRQALLLLTFAGSISTLFTSQPFVHFFEGGVEHRGYSVCSSGSSDQQSYPEGSTEVDCIEAEPWTPQTYFNPELNSSDEEAIESNEDLSEPALDISNDSSAFLDSAKKKWLARAMSLCSEGDDIEILASEAACDGNEFGREGEVFEGDNREPQGKEGQGKHHSQGSVDLLPVLLESSEGEDSGEDEDVFVASNIQRLNKVETTKQPQVCKDAAPDRNLDDYVESLGDVKYHDDQMKISEEVDINKLGECETCSGEMLEINRVDKMLGINITDEIMENNKMDETMEYNRIDETNKNSRTDGMKESDRATETNRPDEMEDNNRMDETGGNNRIGGTTGNGDMEAVKDEDVKELEEEHEPLGRRVSNIGMAWIDPKKKDYLYQAAQIIQQALYCEANELYEEAFNKYKMCVGILLNGVQHDSNSKRREAVRRKTAQYLVKAEFLFNTYLKEEQDGSKEDWIVKSSHSSGDALLCDIVDKRFHQLTLQSLKVIGIIKKVMLVQCEGLEGVIVVKVLHKTNAVHRNAKQEHKQTNKGYCKKYVKSSRMVKLHQHFDTSNNIFLLLEYASGGALWDNIPNLRQRHVVDDVSSRDDVTTEYAQSEPTGGPKKSNMEEGTTPGQKSREENCAPLNNPRDLEVLGNSNATSSNNLSSTKNHINPTYAHVPSTKRTDNVLGDDFSKAETSNSAKRETNSVDNQGQDNAGALGYLDHVTCDSVVYELCVQRWIAELLLAIASVHSCGIILKDLKPANVLLDDSSHVILTYFGVWEEVDHSVDAEAVERLYCAPEISRGEKITVASDWWSLGVLSYELITGKTLFSTHPWGIHPHSSINFPTENISAEACSFLKELICHNPSERLGSGMAGVEEIKSHAFFKGVDWNELY